jgi:hypothetical protein
MENIVSWMMAALAGVFVAAWLLYKLYEHDYKIAHKNENKFDYWS